MHRVYPAAATVLDLPDFPGVPLWIRQVKGWIERLAIDQPLGLAAGTAALEGEGSALVLRVGRSRHASVGHLGRVDQVDLVAVLGRRAIHVVREVNDELTPLGWPQ